MQKCDSAILQMQRMQERAQVISEANTLGLPPPPVCWWEAERKHHL